MKQIKLVNQHLFALVDDEDFEFLSKYPWYLHQTKTSCYARTEISDNGILMHWLVIPSPSPNLTVDHKNGNGLDNQKSNLRLATSSQQRANQTKTKSKTSSKYKGVCYRSREDKFQAYIKKDGKFKSLGFWENEDNAARAYNRAAREFFGEFAKLNIIDKQAIN